MKKREREKKEGTISMKGRKRRKRKRIKDTRGNKRVKGSKPLSKKK